MKLVKELRKLEIVKKGKFILTSGKTSDFYVDMKKALGYPKVSELICDEFCKLVDKRATCVASIGYGGLALAARGFFKIKISFFFFLKKTP